MNTYYLVALLLVVVTTTRGTSAITRHPSTSLGVQQGLLADKEGNIYSPRSCLSSRQTASTDAATRRRLINACKLASIRGGALYVDDEGNFYSPRRTASSTFLTPPEQRLEGLTSATDSNVAFVRGGVIKNNRIDGLCAASSVRGGSLCVDNEGNFYSPRTVAEEARSSPSAATIACGRRRCSSSSPMDSSHKKVVLAKNRRKKKKTDSASADLKPNKRPSNRR